MISIRIDDAHSLTLNSVWGFLIALLLINFLHTTRENWISVGTAAGIITILRVWCIMNTWDLGDREEEP